MNAPHGARVTPAEREIARHRVTVTLCNRAGDVVEEHRMQSWDMWSTVGPLAGAFRDAHGYEPIVRASFPGGRDAHFLIPRSWQ